MNTTLLADYTELVGGDHFTLNASKVVHLAVNGGGGGRSKCSAGTVWARKITTTDAPVTCKVCSK